MVSAKDDIKKAGAIADEAVDIKCFGNKTSVLINSASFDAIESILSRRVLIEPDNYEYRYWLACAKLAKGLGETALGEIREISCKYPDYVEAQGFSKRQGQWFSPFYYPSWSEDKKRLPEPMADLPEGGVCVVSVRDQLRRVVSFFRKISGSSFEQVFFKKMDAAIKMRFAQTPFGAVVGVYLLVFGKNPVQNNVSETILNVDTLPTEMYDISCAGYWLAKLLSNQSYTYIIFSDSKNNIVFNKKLYFNNNTKKNLMDTAKSIESVIIKNNFNSDMFLKARQYYMDRFSLDGLFTQ